MQLPPEEEIVMLSGHPPVRAQKLRYYEDSNFTARVRLPAGVIGPKAIVTTPRCAPTIGLG